MWIIATTNKCTYLCKYKSDTKLSSTSDPSKAFKFNSKKEAQSYIDHNLPKNTRSKYMVIKQSEVSTDDPLNSVEWLNLGEDKCVTALTAVNDIIDKLPSYRKQLEVKKVQVEDALVDIYHYIEFNNLGTVAAYKIYKQEQELLRLRRRVKEELYLVEQLMKSSVHDLHIKEFLKTVDRNKDRTYIPKVLDELFKNGADTEESAEN